MSSCQRHCEPGLIRLPSCRLLTLAHSLARLRVEWYVWHESRLKQIKPEYFEDSGTLRLLSDKVGVSSLHRVLTINTDSKLVIQEWRGTPGQQKPAESEYYLTCALI